MSRDWSRLTESHGPATPLDLPGLLLASLGLLGIVFGVVRGNAHGWTSLTVLPPLVAGALLVAAFAAWEMRAPQRQCRCASRWQRRLEYSISGCGERIKVAWRVNPAASTSCTTPAGSRK